MHEKDMYQAVEKFLKVKKSCLPEYAGTELSLKRGKTSLRAEGGLEYQINVKRPKG